MIKYVENLSSKLYSHRVIQFGRLADGTVGVVEGGAGDHVPSETAKARDRRENFRIEPIVHLSEHGYRTIYVGSQGASDTVYGAVHRDDIQGIAALRLHNGGNLPAFNQLISVSR